jgi:hypothetical protein
MTNPDMDDLVNYLVSGAEKHEPFSDKQIDAALDDFFKKTPGNRALRGAVIDALNERLPNNAAGDRFRAVIKK